jgi:hypothetical protein
LIRFPRAIQAAQDRAGRIRERVSARKNGRTLVYLGAGLALAGAGAATAGGLFAATASAPGLGDSVKGAGSPTSVSHRHSAAVHPITQKASDDSKAVKGSRLVVRSAGHKHVVANRGTAHQREVAARQVQQAETWGVIAHAIAARTSPAVHRGSLPAQDRLTPTGVSGPQSWMPMTQARYANASAIVHEAVAEKMGLRSAVIGVATAMQESTLLNINYGTSDSVGLFQQRPSMGWGTVNQIMHPVYAADAFFKALRTYQANDPTWAHQPLWQSAQGVQASGFPTAYAKWEAQAAHIVSSVASNMI